MKSKKVTKDRDWINKAWKESQRLELLQKFIDDYVGVLKAELIDNTDKENDGLLFYSGRNHGINRAIYLATHLPKNN